ncbi:MAG: 50S ribosomal protein L15 [Caulobacteraceae bacterium]
MTKLNELAPRPGSHRSRMRVGRGPGSGKGKTSGRGVKGQKSRSGGGMGAFEGGQMPLHMRMPKRGFSNPDAKVFAEVNFWRIEKAIAAGRLDPKGKIDAAALHKAGVIRRERDGVKLLAKGELKAKLDLHVWSASAAAKAAVEKAGGSLTEARPPKAEKAESPAGTDA